MEKETLQGGLNPKKDDVRDFKLGRITKLPEVEKLPYEFYLFPLDTEHQGNSDFCSAFSTTGMSELQEGVSLSPEWSFAASKKLSKDKNEWGQDMRTAMKAHVEYGAIKKEDSPFSIDTHSAKFLRDIDNWPEELFEKAKEHKKESYFEVTGQHDHFDNIRATIWKFRNLKRAPGIGLMWGWKMDNPFIETPSQNGYGHMLYAIGWTKEKGKDWIILQNSYGDQVGQNGRYFISREALNPMVERYGSYMFVDLPKDVAKYMSDKGVSMKWSWLIKIVVALKKLLSL